MTKLGLRFTTGHALLVAILAPACIIFFTQYYGRRDWGIAVVVAAACFALVTVRGRRATGWLRALLARLWLPWRTPPAPSEPVVGATVMPGDHVAVRWQAKCLVAVIELVPRAFTPTVIVGGKAHTDDVVDTELLEELLWRHCPDLEADIVSAGYRVGANATPAVVKAYESLIGPDPAPAFRRTWVLLRADPRNTRKSAQRRAPGAAGLARYLVASTTRIADQLASNGVDAVCSRSFDDFDQATAINFKRERWRMIKGKGSFTVAYTASGGPDRWWVARADRTITRFRVAPGEAPRATVLLSSRRRQWTPRGFSRLSGGQRAALQGQTLFQSRHCQIPVGSAGIMVGETADQNPVYMPFDDVDVSINLGDAQTFAQFAVRAAAAGATVTLGPQFQQFAELIGAQIGSQAHVLWPNGSTTYLGPHPGAEQVILRQNLIDTPRHHGLPIQRIDPAEEIPFQMALPRSEELPPTHGVTRRRFRGKNGWGIASLVLAVLALLTSVSIVLGIVLGIPAVVLGIVARGRVNRGEATNGGVAIAGIAVGTLAIIVAGLLAAAAWMFGGREFVDCAREAGAGTAAQQACVDQFEHDLQEKLGVIYPAISAPIVRTFS